jgi:hypothetical protein
MTPDELIAELMRSGAVQDSIVRFDGALNPRHIRYVDLMQADEKSGNCLPDAVVEAGGQPFVYVVRRDQLGAANPLHAGRLAELVRVLACRSDARYLGVVSPGSLEIYPLGIFTHIPRPLALRNDSHPLPWKALLSGAPPLSSARGEKAAAEEWLESLLFRLLVQAAAGIHKAAPTLTIQQVIALVGRALFFRFLVDRGIVAPEDATAISSRTTTLADMFQDRPTLIDTCVWLDETFNGDFLSIGGTDYQSLLDTVGAGIESVSLHLGNIQHRAVDGQLPLDWGGIKFRHVPVGVLSQVYEAFAHKFIPELARATSVHFTPRHLAEVIIDGVFSAVGSESPHKAKILDPAVGAGVFLVLAFRRLVAERWRTDGFRPDRRVIRHILMTQLAGLDVNRDALNMAALSLHLAALELDPKPGPLSDLKFQKLIGTVLHPVDVQTLGPQAKDPEIGSLSQDVLDRFKGKFDIVVANPPWTGLKGPSASALNRCLSRLVGNGGEGVSPAARYGSPDVPFLLAATHWAKPRGALGFALHGRFLFQREAFELRKLVFKRVRVTGVMNFAALRLDSKLWSTNDAPFVLFVARNEPSAPNDNFYYISPRQEPHLAAVGQFRIDPTAATGIATRAVLDNEFSLKAIFKGGLLGLDLLMRLRESAPRPIGAQLEELGLKFRSGFQLGKPHQRTQDASSLRGLPVATVNMEYQVRPGAEQFSYESVQWPRRPEIYKGPLLLFRESPKSHRALRGTLYSKRDTAYSESFIGVSFYGKPELQPLLDLLYVISYSDLLLYHQLLTSAKFGVERDSALQADLEQFPLVEFQRLAPRDLDRLTEVAALLRAGKLDPAEVNGIVARLYDLTEADEQLIEDTLATELPFTGAKQKANMPVTAAELAIYTETFNRLVAPFLGSGHAAPARTAAAGLIEGWAFIEILPPLAHGASTGTRASEDLPRLAELGGSYWSSQLRLHRRDGSQLIGRLDQWRYWTPTQARLLALEWLQSGPLAH